MGTANPPVSVDVLQCGSAQNFGKVAVGTAAVVTVTPLLQSSNANTRIKIDSPKPNGANKTRAPMYYKYCDDLFNP
jgi:hypothetical protein